MSAYEVICWLFTIGLILWLAYFIGRCRGTKAEHERMEAIARSHERFMDDFWGAESERRRQSGWEEGRQYQLARQQPRDKCGRWGRK